MSVFSDLCAPQRATITTLVLTTLYFCYDIIHDVYIGDINFHFYLEVTLFILILSRLYVELRASFKLADDLEQAKTITANLSGQLSSYIAEQFKEWKFTQTEINISWLMLKGFSFKDIAELRDVKEKTIRQQASAIYAKAGCTNRNEFNSLFFEELIIGMSN